MQFFPLTTMDPNWSGWPPPSTNDKNFPRTAQAPKSALVFDKGYVNNRSYRKNDRTGSILRHIANENSKYEVISNTPGELFPRLLSGGTILETTRHRLKSSEWAPLKMRWSTYKESQERAKNTHISEPTYSDFKSTSIVLLYREPLGDRALFQENHTKLELRYFSSDSSRRNQTQIWDGAASPIYLTVMPQKKKKLRQFKPPLSLPMPNPTWILYLFHQTNWKQPGLTTGANLEIVIGIIFKSWKQGVCFTKEENRPISLKTHWFDHSKIYSMKQKSSHVQK